MNKIYNYLLVLSFALITPFYVFSQTHSFTDLVYDSGGNIVYQLSGNVLSASTGNTITVNVSDANGVALTAGDVEVYRNTIARHSGRVRITMPSIPLDANGQAVFTDNTITSTDPHFYSVKINGSNCMRAYPGIYLPNAAADVTVETIGTSTITTSVYPNPNDLTAILAVEYATNADFVDLLESTNIIPIYPAGSKPIYYQEVLVDSDNNPSGRINVNGADFLYWGHEGVTYLKITVPQAKVPFDGTSYAWLKSGRNRGNSSTPIPIRFGVQLPTLAGTIHEVEDVIFDGSTEIFNVSVDVGSNSTTNTLIFNITDPSGNPVQSGNIDVYENSEARLSGRSQIANDLPITAGYVVYEHTGVAAFTPIYYSIKVNNNKSSSRTYPAIDLPTVQSTTVDGTIPLTTKVYDLDDGNGTVIIQLNITDTPAFQALLSTPLKPAEGAQVHYSRVYSDTDPNPNGRVQIPGLIARWGSEGITYIKTQLNTPASSIYYLWVKDGLNVGESTTPIPVSVTLSGPLPIELISFDAKANDQRQVDISWSTASEINHSHFVVEDSKDGLVFESIGEINSEGDGFITREYTYVDRHPKYDQIYYRLKSVDLDGTLQFSDIVSVKLGSSNSKIRIYPNPAQNELFIDGIEEGSQIIIFNSFGASVKNRNITNKMISLEDLPNGVYFIDIITQNSKLTQKIIINK